MSKTIDGRLFRYIKQDGIANWWKEAISSCAESAHLGQWRRIWWLINVVEGQECGCADDRDWICRRCWVLANARWMLGASYFRDGDDASGYSHGGALEGVTAR
jgi:hypothetical protein